MTFQALLIQWIPRPELVPLTDLSSSQRTITTSELLGDTRLSYVAKIIEYTEHGTQKILRLSYEPNEQTDSQVLDPANGTQWGASTIKWDSATQQASAEWDDVDGEQWSGSAKKVTLLGGQSPFEDDRRSASVIVKLRPKQRELREQLVLIDKCCVLSGEDEISALEAAHVIPVKSGGKECVENAILLRADLHKLFDAGLLWFEFLEGAAVARHSHSLSKNYRDLLAGVTLDKATFSRVEAALRERAKRPDGMGFNTSD